MTFRHTLASLGKLGVSQYRGVPAHKRHISNWDVSLIKTNKNYSGMTAAFSVWINHDGVVTFYNNCLHILGYPDSMIDINVSGYALRLPQKLLLPIDSSSFRKLSLQ